jgi:heme exporter protein C
VYGKGLRALSISTVAVMALALALVFFWAPLEAEQGFLQKIFYVHVPLAIVSLCGFVVGGIFAIQHLRTRDPRWDMRSYVAIHMALIFGVATLITGSIWAKGSWGHWWVWSEPTLVSFLIVFLLYATYQPLRFAIEDPERQARYASVFAITAGAFVPLNFIAVRLSSAYLHPRVLGATSNLPWQMALTFLVSLIAIALLYVTLCKYELTAKHTRAQLRALRRIAERRAGSPAALSARRGRSAAPSMHATAMSAHPRSGASSTGAGATTPGPSTPAGRSISPGPSIPRPGA